MSTFCNVMQELFPNIKLMTGFLLNHLCVGIRLVNDSMDVTYCIIWFWKFVFRHTKVFTYGYNVDTLTMLRISKLMR